MPKQIKPKVTFYIDKSNRNKKGLAPIKANITVNYKNTSKIIDHALPTDWNKKQQRVRPARPGKDNNHEIINKKLEKLQKDFEAFADNCELNNIEITPDIVRQAAVVTGCEKTHYTEIQDAIASYQRQYPGRKIIFYDLGLTKPQRVDVSFYYSPRMFFTLINSI